MLDLIKVSIRNVGRNKRRTLITIITVFIGVMVTVGTRGLLNGLQGEIKSGLTRKMHGDLQIHQRGYQDSLESNPYKILIPYASDVVDKIKTVKGIESVTPRLRVMGLLNHQKSQTTTPVMISGINSTTELDVCPRLAQSVQSGTMLDSAKEQTSVQAVDDNLEEATGLTLNEANGVNVSTPNTSTSIKARGNHQIMITPGLMRGLNAQLGDEIVILLQDKDNMQQAIVSNITAVVDYGMPNANNRMAWMDFSTLQDTLNLKGQASELALRTDQQLDVDSLRVQLSQALPENFFVETWLDIGGFFRDVMALQNVIFSTILLIMFTIVISAIINTSLMTVMERTREIGTLMALGYRRSHIILLFLGESSVIGFVGGIVGILVSTALVTTLNYNGIHLKMPGQSVGTVLFPTVSPAFLIGVFVSSGLAALIAGVVPAYRASRLRPVQALNSI